MRLEAASKELYIFKNSVPIRSIPFKCIFVRLEKALMRGKNECEIPLALYIRLEYSANVINMYVTFNLLMVLEKQTFSKINFLSCPGNQSNSAIPTKNLITCGELFNKHFCKNKILLSTMKQ